MIFLHDQFRENLLISCFRLLTKTSWLTVSSGQDAVGSLPLLLGGIQDASTSIPSTANDTGAVGEQTADEFHTYPLDRANDLNTRDQEWSSKNNDRDVALATGDDSSEKSSAAEG